ncbi:unnamed protein product [Ixodes hexagonus]
MLHPAEYAIFGVLLLATLGPGIFFSLRRSGPPTIDEVFLGSRTIKALPLALSALASLMSSAGLIAFTAHYYAYGIHMVWSFITVQLCLPVTVHIIIPVLYRLKITSLFEYLRIRYGKKISLTACAIYFILTQSIGAVAIFAAAMAVTTIFQVSFLWCCLAIGFTGTLYTALGGLRGVVWTDCVQAVITLIAPITIIVKIIYDSATGNFRLRPLGDINPRVYFLDASLDFTKDENLWSCLIGVTAAHMYRSGLDQMIIQRYMASRTLEDAKSTISSIINSQAVVLYIDVVSQYFVLTDLQATRVTKIIALAVGFIMTLYSAVIPYIGSATRLLLMVSSATTGPFVGLFLSALMFPCINSKGAGIATLLTTIFQLWHINEKIRLGIQPPRMPVTVDYCPGNMTTMLQVGNTTLLQKPRTLDDVFVLSRLSSYWSNSISAVLTILLALVISALTGGPKAYKKRLHLTSDVCLRFWRKLKLISADYENKETSLPDTVYMMKMPLEYERHEVEKLTAGTIT